MLFQARSPFVHIMAHMSYLELLKYAYTLSNYEYLILALRLRGLQCLKDSQKDVGKRTIHIHILLDSSWHTKVSRALDRIHATQLFPGLHWKGRACIGRPQIYNIKEEGYHIHPTVFKKQFADQRLSE
jgi:hypothetical protein